MIPHHHNFNSLRVLTLELMIYPLISRPGQTRPTPTRRKGTMSAPPAQLSTRTKTPLPSWPKSLNPSPTRTTTGRPSEVGVVQRLVARCPPSPLHEPPPTHPTTTIMLPPPSEINISPPPPWSSNHLRRRRRWCSSGQGRLAHVRISHLHPQNCWALSSKRRRPPRAGSTNPRSHSPSPAETGVRAVQPHDTVGQITTAAAVVVVGRTDRWRRQ